MISRLLFVLFVLSAGSVRSAYAQDSWQTEWERTLKAAEQEGQVVYSGCGSHDFLKEFQKQFPKIKLVSVSLSCTQLVSRIMAERRAGKYLADVVRFGLTSAHSFYRAKVLQPIDSAFIMPEVKDPSKWWQNKHHYSDPEGKYLIIPAASIYERFASYHAALASPSEFKSFADVLNPSGKARSSPPTPRPAKGATARASCITIPSSGRRICAAC